MKISFLHSRVFIAICGTALLVSSGCGKSKFQDPSTEQIKSFLEGQDIVTRDVKIPIFLDDISLLKIVEIVAEPKEEYASAIVSFEYRHDGQSYNVAGVVSYKRSESDPFMSPYFEVNELN